MAEGATFILHGNRERVYRALDCAPVGSVVTVKPPRRTLDQNAKFFATLTEIARAKPEGRSYPVDVWKALFMAQCGHKMRFEPSLDGDGVVPIGFRSSRLSKDQFSELIECANAYAASHGIELRDA